jgi:hypothetical protein
MKKQYLQDGEEAYTTGAFLTWDDEAKDFKLEYLEDETYYNGRSVYFTNNERPYVDLDEKPVGVNALKS